MQKPLKIIRVAAIPNEENPGSGIAAYKLSDTSRFETQLFTYSSKSKILYEEKINPVKIAFPNPTMPQNRKGLKFFILQVQRFYAILFFFMSFLTKAHSSGVDIVHVHSPMHFLIIWWANFKKIPAFLSIHGTDFRRITGSRFYQLLLKYVDNINCVSQSDILELKKIFPNAKVNLISNGVDRAFFIPDTDSNPENIILGIGTLRWQKNFKNLIYACAKSFQNQSGWKLKIIGEGQDRESLEKLIEDLNMKNKIFLMGSLSRQELTKELKKARIFALSSVTEGLPKVLLEAMSAKCACIATDVGDCKRVLGSNGLIVNNNDIDALSYAISLLLEDNELIDDLGSKACEESKHYSWEAYLDKHEILYKQL